MGMVSWLGALIATLLILLHPAEHEARYAIFSIPGLKTQWKIGGEGG